ncbi:MAG: hypothetical protein U0324_32115 [Polyangiales bacterium]
MLLAHAGVALAEGRQTRLEGCDDAAELGAWIVRAAAARGGRRVRRVTPGRRRQELVAMV